MALHKMQKGAVWITLLIIILLTLSSLTWQAPPSIQGNPSSEKPAPFPPSQITPHPYTPPPQTVQTETPVNSTVGGENATSISGRSVNISSVRASYLISLINSLKEKLWELWLYITSSFAPEALQLGGQESASSSPVPLVFYALLLLLVGVVSIGYVIIKKQRGTILRRSLSRGRRSGTRKPPLHLGRERRSYLIELIEYLATKAADALGKKAEVITHRESLVVTESLSSEELAEELRKVVYMYEKVRFGEEPFNPGVEKSAKELLNKLGGVS